MKAISNDNIIYANFSKKKITETDIFNKNYDKWKNIKRPNENKPIASEAITFISSIEYFFIKNPDEVAFDCDYLVRKVNQKKKQRGRFLKQLSDIYNIQFHQSYNYKGKEMRLVFLVTRTENSLKILENPKRFYQQLARKSDSICGQKGLQLGSVLTPARVKFDPSSTYVYREIREEKEEEALAYSSSFSVLSVTNTKSDYVKKEFSQEENIEERTLAASPFDGLAKVQQKEEIRRETSFFPSQSAEEEKEYLRSHGKRESSGEELIPLGSLSIIAKLCTPHISEEKEETPTVIIEKNEENSEIGYNSREPDNLNQNCEMETDINTLIFKALGHETGTQLIKNCEINLIEPDKVGIKLGQGIIITNYEREQLRDCIRSAYGENTKIISLNKPEEKPRVNKATDIQSGVETPERLELWEIFKKAFGDYLGKVERDSPHVVEKRINNLFGKTERTQILSENKLIFKGGFIRSVLEKVNYQGLIEEIAIANKMTIEFCEKDQARYECTIFPEPISPKFDFDKYDKLYPIPTRSKKRSENVKRQSEDYYVSLNENGVAILIKK